MKRIVLALVAFCAFFYAQAQTDQGTVLLSGGIGFAGSGIRTETFTGDSLTTDDGPTTTEINFYAMPGFFVADYMALGLGLGYTSESAKSVTAPNTSLKLTTSMFQISPTLRYYAEMDRELFFLGQLQLGLGFGSVNTETTTGSTTVTNTDKLNMFTFGITPGFSYMFSETVSFEMMFGFIGYEQVAIKTDLPKEGEYTKDITSGFGLQASLSDLRFGISIHL
ncbi:MAG TPA: outer membrane beta-barrel protein [Bacteroidales bacterium]|nr:outer membrane beta-barrel protein [Bacteroidales bacterium]HRZ49347.1 outer membrane beta-barrel protein [Bacteroidales bacterium]